MIRTAVIRRCKKKDKDPDRPVSKQRWCLYDSKGKKLLGRHPTKNKALKQERAIQVHKHGASDDVSYPIGKLLSGNPSKSEEVNTMAVEEKTPSKLVEFGGHMYVLAEDAEPEDTEVEDMDGDEEEDEGEEDLGEVDLVDALRKYWGVVLDKLPDDLETDEELEEALNGIEDIIGVLEELQDEYKDEGGDEEEDEPEGSPGEEEA